jgi:HEAT repeat protein
MADRRLVDYNITRLKDKNREIRLRSVEELRLLGDPIALPALEELFRIEEDKEIREAAQRAGREIYQKQNPSVNFTKPTP